MKRFIQLNEQLFRGSAPLPNEVVELKKRLGINKIISLDKESGVKIARICHLLGIKHLIFPLEQSELVPLFKLLSQDIYHLLMKDGPTFFHCIEGKDRTGLLGALYRCKFLGWSCEKALKEAVEIGFGDGLPEKTTSTYVKAIVANCSHHHTHVKSKSAMETMDINDAREIGTDNVDIASNSRIYDTDYEGSVLDQATMQSFAPFSDYIREYPWDSVYQYKYDQFPTRNNFDLDKRDQVMMEKLLSTEEGSDIPQVGLYDNVEGVKGIGPVDNGGGFLSY
jgi:hypothetical protein